MSLRNQLKVPRYGLFYFEYDKTVSIVPMNKIKKVLNGDNTSKGSIVEIMFGKDPLKAKIIAVHGKWYFSIWMVVLHLLCMKT
jgi:hypothetical protein